MTFTDPQSSRPATLRKQDDEQFFETLNYPAPMIARPASALKTKLILANFVNQKTDGLGAQRVKKLLQ